MIVWQTDHIRNRIMTDAVYQGLSNNGVPARIRLSYSYREGDPVEPSISYGILRSMDVVYRACQEQGVDWWNIDRGFFRAEHFDGYYRIGYRHLQPLYRDVPVDPSRWEALGVSVEPGYALNPNGYILLCPPTKYISIFYDVDVGTWLRSVGKRIPWKFRKRLRVRNKGSLSRTLDEDLSGASGIVTFNSNVAIHALLRGIPAVATTGMVRSWNGCEPEDLMSEKLLSADRLKLFRFAAWTQFEIDEIASGFAWKTLREIYQWKEDHEPVRNDA